ncbi:MAG TPA: hypothetical protein VI685_06780 [Candidatus Angelobacter sp.]
MISFQLKSAAIISDSPAETRVGTKRDKSRVAGPFRPAVLGPVTIASNKDKRGKAIMAKESTQTKGPSSSSKMKKLNRLVEALCGIYTRVARRLGVDRSFVSRVARGERHSEVIEDALVSEYDRAQKH